MYREFVPFTKYQITQRTLVGCRDVCIEGVETYTKKSLNIFLYKYSLHFQDFDQGKIYAKGKQTQICD